MKTCVLKKWKLVQKLEDWLVKIYVECRWVLRTQSETQDEAFQQTQSTAKSC